MKRKSPTKETDSKKHKKPKTQTAMMDNKHDNNSNTQVPMTDDTNNDEKEGNVQVSELVDLGTNMIPKSQNEQTLMGCVIRPKFYAIWGKLEQAVANPRIPGYYLADAPGCGKSTALYWCVVRAREKKWIAPYIARCDEWCGMEPLEAKAFFVDRVWDAVVAAGAEEDFMNIKPPIQYDTWVEFSDAAMEEKDEQIIRRAFKQIITALKKYETRPVLLVFDEENGLHYDRDNRPWQKYKQSPWNLPSFSGKLTTLNKGCMIISGTVDAPFVQSINPGYESLVLSMGKLDEKEQEAWTRSPMFTCVNNVLGSLTLTPGEKEAKIQYLFAVTGALPRPLAEFAMTNLPRAQCGDHGGTPQSIWNEACENDRTYQKRSYTGVIDAFFKRRGENDQNRAVWKLVQFYLYRDYNPSMDLLSMGIFHHSTKQLRPITPLANNLLWKTLVERLDTTEFSNKFAHAQLEDFKHLKGTEMAEGDKGYSWERYFIRHILINNVTTIHYTSLDKAYSASFSLHNEYATVRNAQEAPQNWKEFEPNTTVTHTKSGEAGFDLIYYNSTTVHFIDFTVSKVQDKLPSDAKTRTDTILRAIEKWLGKDHYEASVEEGKINIKCKHTNTRAIHVPTVHFYIATVRPFTHNFTKDKMNAYPYVRVIAGEQLVKSALFSQEDIVAISESFD